MEYRYNIIDLIEIILFFAFVIGGCMYLVIKKPKTIINYKYVYRPIIAGIVFLIIGIVSVSLMKQSLDINLILAYITLHRISGAEFFQILAYMSYALICYGVTTLVIYKRIKRIKNSEDK
jgi:hypothetical protein